MINKINESLEAVSSEVGEAEYGSTRLTHRLTKMIDTVMSKPHESFPEIFDSDAELEAAYRWLRNPNVTWQKTLAPYFKDTCRKAIQEEGDVLVIHDTTFFKFSGEKRREGLGNFNHKSDQGFLGHFALAVSAETHLPLGVIGLETHCREIQVKRPQKEYRNKPNKESLRWGRLVKTVEDRIEERFRPIHVADREADLFPLLDQLTQNNQRLVIRARFNRKVIREDVDKLFESLEGLSSRFEREVGLSRRGYNKEMKVRKGGRNPLREKRMATLQFTAKNIEIKRPHKGAPGCSRTIKLNAVRVYEINTPVGETPVEWNLLTTEPIKTVEEIAKIVDIYRARWLIEEFNKALKTGCSYEKRQLESIHTLENALSLFIPVACRLLLLRHLNRTNPKAEAKVVLSEVQIKILCSIAKLKLPAKPSVREILMAVAQIGGHIKNNGDPGWQVLGRGYTKLLNMEIGYHANL